MAKKNIPAINSPTGQIYMLIIIMNDVCMARRHFNNTNTAIYPYSKINNGQSKDFHIKEQKTPF
jgi:hypothetical protein